MPINQPPQWNTVTPNFNTSNQLIGLAGQQLSQAGNVFSKLGEQADASIARKAAAEQQLVTNEQAANVLALQTKAGERAQTTLDQQLKTADYNETKNTYLNKGWDAVTRDLSLDKTTGAFDPKKLSTNIRKYLADNPETAKYATVEFNNMEMANAKTAAENSIKTQQLSQAITLAKSPKDKTIDEVFKVNQVEEAKIANKVYNNIISNSPEITATGAKNALNTELIKLGFNIDNNDYFNKMNGLYAAANEENKKLEKQVKKEENFGNPAYRTIGDYSNTHQIDEKHQDILIKSIGAFKNAVGGTVEIKDILTTLDNYRSLTGDISAGPDEDGRKDIRSVKFLPNTLATLGSLLNNDGSINPNNPLIIELYKELPYKVHNPNNKEFGLAELDKISERQKVAKNKADEEANKNKQETANKNKVYADKILNKNNLPNNAATKKLIDIGNDYSF